MKENCARVIYWVIMTFLLKGAMSKIKSTDSDITWNMTNANYYDLIWDLCNFFEKSTVMIFKYSKNLLDSI